MWETWHVGEFSGSGSSEAQGVLCLQLTAARSKLGEKGYPGTSEPPAQMPGEFLQLAQSEKLLSSDLELSAAFVESPLGK